MPSPDTAPIARALISVSDKTGLAPFATRLNAAGVDLVSTGGTANALREAELPVADVSDLTKFPEMLDGRVKTLHPGVHGGLLALRGNAEHEAAIAAHDIAPIDLLVVNLYPFEETIAKGADYDTCIENIDIGGPAMIRAAAKNHAHVAVVVDIEDYEAILTEIEAEGGVTLETRKRLAAKAYARTAAYDAAISGWFADVLGEEHPKRRAFAGALKHTVRYGENPHQSAGFYLTGEDRPGVAAAKQIQGKELSYNNINDTDAAFECVAEFDAAAPAVAIIKHANPCGVAVGATLVEAYEKALSCDPVSAFGGVIALNGRLDKASAEKITEIFTEVIIAPGADDDAREIIARKKNLRLLLTGDMPDPTAPGLALKTVAGGLLVQTADRMRVTKNDLKIVSKRQPTPEEFQDMLFAFKVAKHVKSNAIVYAKGGATVGVGAGQMSRLDSARIAVRKSEDAAKAAGAATPLVHGSVVASDAFFPFADGLIAAAEAGATAVIQPGGSIRDEEVIAAADERNLAMAFTGVRHFRH
ncbi:MAG: bifunctional phosphoribosylaminoimidazolecarboxamide formyltransferase/IMP cyclohydrolase [Pseudomonadota bacterium]